MQTTCHKHRYRTPPLDQLLLPKGDAITIESARKPEKLHMLSG
jgi:hypothetical protein